MKYETATIASLMLDPANVRTHDSKNLEAIKASLARFGQQKPIVVNSKGIIVAGNGTMMAAKMLNWSSVEIVRTDLEGAEAIAYAIADNRTAELAGWDEAALAQQLAALQIDDEELANIAGFTDAEIEAMILDGKEIEEDEVPEPPVDPITKTGDLWLLGTHRVLCGDSTKAQDVARLMDGAEVDTVVSDPPYGIAFDTDYTRFSGSCGKFEQGKKHQPIVNDDKPFDPEPFIKFKNVVLFGANCFSSRLPLGTWLVWDKRFKNGTAMLSDAEVAWMKGGHGVYIFAETSQGFVRPERVQHPTQKPVSVMAWCIEKCKAGYIVFDPFLGSGTTLIAAEQLNRKCYGMEISPAYCDVIVKRWETLTGKTATLST